MINWQLFYTSLLIIIVAVKFINEELNQKQNRFNKIPNSASFNKFDSLLS